MPFGGLLAIELTLLVVSIALAWFHAWLIKHDDYINHFLWAAAYSACVLLTLFFWRLPWWLGLVQLCGHLVVFDWSLSWFRHLPINYTSPTTGSVIDRIVGRYLFIVEIVCAVAYISAQFFIL